MNPWTDSEDFARQAAKVESAGEAVLLSLLWWRRAGWTVRAQEPVKPFRIDLVVPEAMVAIEVDSFEGHGSGAAMEHDARKRNAVIAAGWAPLAYSARDALFRSQDTLADILAHVGRRISLRTPRPTAAEPPRPAFDAVTFATGGRALLDAMEQTFAPVKADPSWRAFAHGPARERLALELIGVVILYPALLTEPGVAAAFDVVGGPVWLAADLVRRNMYGAELDRVAVVVDWPSELSTFAFEVIHAEKPDAATARKRALEIVDQIGGA